MAERDADAGAVEGSGFRAGEGVAASGESAADPGNGTNPSTPGTSSPAAGPTPFQPVGSAYQFLGFDPRAHLGETPTVTAPKYAVYNELATLSNLAGFDPLNFASKAAADLNAMFNTSQFKAVDGQTLVYGDEYVHTAPAGMYAALGGDANAAGEFFWGADANLLKG